MNTIKNNKLLEEFLDIRVSFDTVFINGMYITATDEDLQFHSDWNWLMQVVEKIISLKNIYTQEQQRVFLSICPNIGITYDACVEFVKWYNENCLKINFK